MCDNTRQCYECGKKIFQGSFYLQGWVKGVKLDILDMIWENPIFVIKCCECFYNIPLAKIPIRSV